MIPNGNEYSMKSIDAMGDGITSIPDGAYWKHFMGLTDTGR